MTRLSRPPPRATRRPPSIPLSSLAVAGGCCQQDRALPMKVAARRSTRVPMPLHHTPRPRDALEDGDGKVLHLRVGASRALRRRRRGRCPPWWTESSTGPAPSLRQQPAKRPSMLHVGAPLLQTVTLAANGLSMAPEVVPCTRSAALRAPWADGGRLPQIQRVRDLIGMVPPAPAQLLLTPCQIVARFGGLVLGSGVCMVRQGRSSSATRFHLHSAILLRLCPLTPFHYAPPSPSPLDPTSLVRHADSGHAF